MTDPTPPSRPSIAAFLHAPPAGKDDASPAAAPPQPPGLADAATAACDTAAEAPTGAGADSAAASQTPAAAPVTAATAPSFLGRPLEAKANRRTPFWQWALMTALLLLLLLQMLVADRARLAADARWRPLVLGACAALRCSVPAWREPEAFSMLGREVRPVPGMAGVLQVRASFRNDARWAQAWPQLQLSLTDADGRTIGSQAFVPAQYLGRPPADDALLAPGQSAQVTFRVREPSAGTEAFAFTFR